jgi:Flp pilus assembly protein CpaB
MRPLFARPSMLGALLALLVGGGVYTYASGTEDDASGSRVAVVVALQDIPARSKIEPAQLQLKELPPDAVHVFAARTPEVLVGKFTNSAVRAGEQVLTVDVNNGQSGSDLAGLVKPGMRAMAFGVSDASAAGGLVSPGDRIDVIAVFDGDKAALVIADNLEVLAVSTALIGSQPQKKDEEITNQNPTSITATVTVAVAPEIAPRIAMGEVLGALRVSVRGTGDNANVAATPTDLTQLLGVLAIGNR